MINANENFPKTAMNIHAHPDDQEFSIAGTLAMWVKAGCEVISVLVSSDGSNSPSG